MGSGDPDLDAWVRKCSGLVLDVWGGKGGQGATQPDPDVWVAAVALILHDNVPGWAGSGCLELPLLPKCQFLQPMMIPVGQNDVAPWTVFGLQGRG